MIATGGLLRMNRRQDSLRSKNRAENKRKRKSRKKKKNDVVVVKGKLNFCSVAGLVAAVGVIVLMVGVSMAALGYWPSQNQQEYQERRRMGVYHNNRMSFSKSPSGFWNWTSDRSQSESFNQSVSNSSVPGSSPGSSPNCGFLCDFLDNYLYSDNLKVFGPLVMGIGIFLFICANAVLHENRDKKTKIINLRDIYSTVIDLHSMRSKEYSPLNGLVNYTQSRSAEGLSGSLPATGQQTRSSWPGTGLGAGLGPGREPEGDEAVRRCSLVSRDVQTFTDTVYSIYKDYSNSSEPAPRPRPWETTSIVTSSVNAFTLPVIKLNSCEAGESERAVSLAACSPKEVVIEAATESITQETHSSSSGGGSSISISIQTDGMDDKQNEASTHASSPPHGDVAGESARQTETTRKQAELQWSQLFPPSPVTRATGSRLSLNSLTDQPRSARRCSLSVSACRHGDRARRFSCPRLEKGYIKLTDLGGESFEAPDTNTPLGAPRQDGASETEAAATEDTADGERALVTPPTAAPL